MCVRGIPRPSPMQRFRRENERHCTLRSVYCAWDESVSVMKRVEPYAPKKVVDPCYLHRLFVSNIRPTYAQQIVDVSNIHYHHSKLHTCLYLLSSQNCIHDRNMTTYNLVIEIHSCIVNNTLIVQKIFTASRSQCEDEIDCWKINTVRFEP